jgi:hypothetical protein
LVTHFVAPENIIAKLADPTRRAPLIGWPARPIGEIASDLASRPTGHLQANPAFDRGGIDPFAQQEGRANGSESWPLREANHAQGAQLRKIERYWNAILEAFKRYTQGEMKQSKVEADRNGAAARKEPNE